MKAKYLVTSFSFHANPVFLMFCKKCLHEDICFFEIKFKKYPLLASKWFSKQFQSSNLIFCLNKRLFIYFKSRNNFFPQVELIDRESGLRISRGSSVSHNAPFIIVLL